MIKIQCPTCDGKGEAVISCCTGEVIRDDYQMCPECHEHLGEDTCPDCEGSGKVEEDQSLTPVGPDLQLQAEARAEAQKYEV